jgi:hypothetical protein
LPFYLTSTESVDYFFLRNGRFGSVTIGALGAGVNSGALPNSVAVGSASGVIATGAGEGVQVCCGCGTSGEGVIHCG